MHYPISEDMEKAVEKYTSKEYENWVKMAWDEAWRLTYEVVNPNTDSGDKEENAQNNIHQTFLVREIFKDILRRYDGKVAEK